MRKTFVGVWLLCAALGCSGKSGSAASTAGAGGVPDAGAPEVGGAGAAAAVGGNGGAQAGRVSAAGGGARTQAGGGARAQAGSGARAQGGAGAAATSDAGAADSGSPDAGAADGSTLIVGVGAWAFRGRSSDAASWSYCAHASTGNDHSPDLLRGVGYGDGVFIAVGGDQNGMVMRSLDGEHWQQDVHPTNACPGEGYPSSCTNWMGGVAYQNGVWLAGGGNGATMRSRDGGRTWEGLHHGFPEKPIRTMSAGAGRFIAGADGGLLFVTKDDGDSWSMKSPWSGAPSNAALEAAFGNGTFVAFGTSEVASERACFVSSDVGDTWQPCAASVKQSRSFVHDGQQWVTAASGGYATSPDAKTWTMHAAQTFPEQLLFERVSGIWYGRRSTSTYRGESLDSFARVAMNVEEYRSWTIGRVLASNLPITSPAACTDQRSP